MGREEKKENAPGPARVTQNALTARAMQDVAAHALRKEAS